MGFVSRLIPSPQRSYRTLRDGSSFSPSVPGSSCLATYQLVATRQGANSQSIPHQSRKNLTTYRSPLTVHRSPLTAHRLLLTAYCSPLTAHRLLLTAYCLLLTAYCLLLTAYCSLLTAHCLPFHEPGALKNSQLSGEYVSLFGPLSGSSLWTIQ